MPDARDPLCAGHWPVTHVTLCPIFFRRGLIPFFLLVKAALSAPPLNWPWFTTHLTLSAVLNSLTLSLSPPVQSEKGPSCWAGLQSVRQPYTLHPPPPSSQPSQNHYNHLLRISSTVDYGDPFLRLRRLTVQARQVPSVPHFLHLSLLSSHPKPARPVHLLYI